MSGWMFSLTCMFARLALLNSTGESSEQRIRTATDMLPYNLVVFEAALVALGLY